MVDDIFRFVALEMSFGVLVNDESIMLEEFILRDVSVSGVETENH